MTFDCAGGLFGVTSRGVLTSITPATGASRDLCTLSQATSPRHVIALVPTSRVVHFAGDVTPIMELVQLSNTGTGACRVVAVPGYTSQARSQFKGTPVIAAEFDAVTGVADRLFVAAASPTVLFFVTLTGEVTAIAQVRIGSSLVPIVPVSITLRALSPGNDTRCGGAWLPPLSVSLLWLFLLLLLLLPSLLLLLLEVVMVVLVVCRGGGDSAIAVSMCAIAMPLRVSSPIAS
jgi:hypothetical protein